jgi:TetR/AcrR family transcriptional regulator, transcriptional repressor for nem operon
MIREINESNPTSPKSCDQHISAHTAKVKKAFADAKRLSAPKAKWSAESLAPFTLGVVEGAFVFANQLWAPDCDGVPRAFAAAPFSTTRADQAATPRAHQPWPALSRTHALED